MGHDIYGLNKAREETEDFLIKLGLSAELAKEIHQLAVKELEPPMVQLFGNIKITCYESDGATHITNFFKSYGKTQRSSEWCTVFGSPFQN